MPTTTTTVKDEPFASELESEIEKPELKQDLNVPPHILAKLLFFTVAMLGAPMGIYYVSVTSVFVGQSTVAAALAAGTANVVLVAYVIAAMREDVSAPAEGEKKSQ